MQVADQCFDFFGGLLGTLGQATHLVGHYCETTPGFTGTGRLDGRIEGQQVGLLGDGLDHVQHAADLVALALEMTHGFGGIAHFLGQAFDLGDGFTHHFFAFASLLVRGDRRFAGLFGIARHFLHRSGHFVHGGGDLVGFHFLFVDPGAGLLGDGRELFGGTGDLRDTVADAADQLPQAHGHALYGALQLAQFVAALGAEVVGQVTCRHAFGDLERLLQWYDDLPGDRHGSDHAEQQGQRGGRDQQRVGFGRIMVAHDCLGQREVSTGPA